MGADMRVLLLLLARDEDDDDEDDNDDDDDDALIEEEEGRKGRGRAKARRDEKKWQRIQWIYSEMKR